MEATAGTEELEQVVNCGYCHAPIREGVPAWKARTVDKKKDVYFCLVRGNMSRLCLEQGGYWGTCDKTTAVEVEVRYRTPK